MTNSSASSLCVELPALLLGEHALTKSENNCNESLIVTFESLINNVWLRTPPSLAIYDLSFDRNIKNVMEDLRNGYCLKGASGTMYRLSNMSN